MLDLGLDVLAPNSSKSKQPLHWAPEMTTGNYCPYVSESWSFGVLTLGILIGH